MNEQDMLELYHNTVQDLLEEINFLRAENEAMRQNVEHLRVALQQALNKLTQSWTAGQDWLQYILQAGNILYAALYTTCNVGREDDGGQNAVSLRLCDASRCGSLDQAGRTNDVMRADTSHE